MTQTFRAPILLLSILLAVVTVGAVTLVALTHPDHAQQIFSEQGMVEAVSPWAWLALAVAIPCIFRCPTLEVVAGVVVCAAAAAREWDFHIWYTGYSVLKIPFYYREGTWPQRLVAGTVVLAVLASLAVLVRWQLSLKPWVRPIRPWVWTTLFAEFILVLGKVIDRAPAIMDERLGFTLGHTARGVFYAVEEGLEMMTPVFFALACLSIAHALRRGTMPV